MSIKIILNALTVIICTSLCSCKKFVDIKPSSDIIETSAIFLSDKTVLSAVDNVYVTLRSGTVNFANGSASVYCGLASDEIYAATPTTTTDPFFLNQLNASNTTVYNNFYSNPYKTLYQVNLIIEGLNRSGHLPDSTRRQFLGEMKFTRAFIYFYLSQYFGGVPMVLSTDYRINSLLPRSDTDKINQQILKDLIDAKGGLSSIYPSAEKLGPINGQLRRYWPDSIYI